MGSRFLNILKRSAGEHAPRTQRRGVGPIGLDFSLERLNMVQMERSNGSLGIRAAASLPYPGDRQTLLSSPAELRALLHRACKDHPFRGRRVVTSPVRGDLKLINLSYDVRPGASDEAAIVKAVQERLGADLADWVVDYLPIRSADGSSAEKSALVVSAKRDGVISYLELLRQCGLEVAALEVGPVGIRRLITYMGREDAATNVLAINFGKAKSYISVIWGRRLVMNREVEFGEDQLTTRVGEALEISESDARSLLSEYGIYYGHDHEWEGQFVSGDEEVARSLMEIARPSFAALVEEVNKALIYTSSLTRGGSVQRAYLFGGIARWPGADRLLNSLLSIPAEVPNPFNTFQAHGAAPALNDSYPVVTIALAAGYALRGMVDHG